MLCGGQGIGLLWRKSGGNIQNSPGLSRFRSHWEGETDNGGGLVELKGSVTQFSGNLNVGPVGERGQRIGATGQGPLNKISNAQSVEFATAGQSIRGRNDCGGFIPL